MKISLNNTEVLVMVKSFLQAKGFPTELLESSLSETSDNALDFHKDASGKFVLHVVVGEDVITSQPTKKERAPKASKQKTKQPVTDTEPMTEKDVNVTSQDAALFNDTTEVNTETTSENGPFNTDNSMDKGW